MRCGRRFGKTTMFEDLACLFSMDGQSHDISHGLNVGWFSPKYKYMQGSFRRIRAALKPIITRSSITDGIIELDEDIGGIIRFWTLQDEDAGRGDFYHEIFIDEVSLVEKGMRDIFEQSIAPTLLDYNGNAWMAGTPKGIDPDNFFYFASTNKDSTQGQIWTEFHAPTTANPAISTKALAEFKEQLSPLVYKQEILAEFVDWSGDNFFNTENLLTDGKPVKIPASSQSLFCVVDTAIKDGQKHDCTAITFFSFDIYPTPQLTILDWDLVQIQGAFLDEWIPSQIERLRHFSNICNPRAGMTAWVEDKASGTVLLQKLGHYLKPLPSKMTAIGKSGRAIACSGAVYNGKVKITEHAFNKVMAVKGDKKNHLLSQIGAFRIGIDNGADDLLDTFCYGALLTVSDINDY